MLRQVLELAESVSTYQNPLLGSTVASCTLLLTALIADLPRGVQDLTKDPTVWIALLAFVLFLALWLLSWNRIRRSIEQRYLKSRFKKPKVGVLSIAHLSDDDFRKIAKCCDFSPRTWVDGLQAKGLQAQHTDCGQISDGLDILVNPFGERYLESEVANMRTLKFVKQFVREGGVFVNAGGLAFYYMYDPISNVEGLTGPMFMFHIGGALDAEYRGTTGTYKPSTILEPRVHPEESSLIDTWLSRNLGLRTTLGNQTTRGIQPAHKGFADILQADSKLEEFRAVERCESKHAMLIPIFKSRYKYLPTGRQHECYPVAAVRYGLGYFIICGIVLSEPAHKTLVEQTIVRTWKILAEQGRLESS